MTRRRLDQGTARQNTSQHSRGKQDIRAHWTARWGTPLVTSCIRYHGPRQNRRCTPSVVWMHTWRCRRSCRPSLAQVEYCSSRRTIHFAHHPCRWKEWYGCRALASRGWRCRYLQLARMHILIGSLPGQGAGRLAQPSALLSGVHCNSLPHTGARNDEHRFAYFRPTHIGGRIRATTYCKRAAAPQVWDSARSGLGGQADSCKAPAGTEAR
jgi:hypothetical protein